MALRHSLSLITASTLAFMLVTPQARAEEPQVRALEAKAICVALAAYQKTSPDADLRHFSILVDKEGRDYDIVFLPDLGPGEKPHTGGSTHYGAEVHYIISHRTFKILKVHFAR
jgi:hypothetical protein